jgi:hypothetical protein
MSTWKWLLVSFFGGGIAFRISDVIIPALDRNEKGYAVSLLCPVVLVLFYMVALRLRTAGRSGPSTAIFAIFGMWVLALPFITLAQTVRGNGFIGGSWSWGDFGYLLVSSFLPTRIVEFAMLEGSIMALGIGTAAMIICQFAFERTSWIVPPSLWAALRRVTQ